MRSVGREVGRERKRERKREREGGRERERERERESKVRERRERALVSMQADKGDQTGYDIILEKHLNGKFVMKDMMEFFRERYTCVCTSNK